MDLVGFCSIRLDAISWIYSSQSVGVQVRGSDLHVVLLWCQRFGDLSSYFSRCSVVVALNGFNVVVMMFDVL